MEVLEAEFKKISGENPQIKKGSDKQKVEVITHTSPYSQKQDKQEKQNKNEKNKNSNNKNK